MSLAFLFVQAVQFAYVGDLPNFHGEQKARISEGWPKEQKLGANWGPNGIAVMDQTGINPRPVDVTYPCSEGWEGPELASSVNYTC